LTEDFEPIWSQRVFGFGSLAPQVNLLELHSPPGFPTFIALNDNPEGSWFDYSIELRQAPPWPNDKHPSDNNRLGIFFGWREDPQALPRKRVQFFAIKLDETPIVNKHANDQFGRLSIGTRFIHEGTVGFEEADGLQMSKDYIPLSQKEVWHQVFVRAEDDEITVGVDQQATRITMKEIREHGLNLRKNPPLDPRGALGIWVQNGIGSFRNANLKYLPGKE
jgi:hypothetical protein